MVCAGRSGWEGPVLLDYHGPCFIWVLFGPMKEGNTAHGAVIGVRTSSNALNKGLFEAKVGQ